MNIYVGNLPTDVTVDELRQVFTAFGQVVSVTIMDEKHNYGGEIRGYGFVEMLSKSEGEAAIVGLVGKILDGQMITVIGALPLSPKKEIRSFHGSRGRRLRSEKRATA